MSVYSEVSLVRKPRVGRLTTSLGDIGEYFRLTNTFERGNGRAYRSDGDVEHVFQYVGNSYFTRSIYQASGSISIPTFSSITSISSTKSLEVEGFQAKPFQVNVPDLLQPGMAVATEGREGDDELLFVMDLEEDEDDITFVIEGHITPHEDEVLLATPALGLSAVVGHECGDNFGDEVESVQYEVPANHFSPVFEARHEQNITLTSLLPLDWHDTSFTDFLAVNYEFGDNPFAAVPGSMLMPIATEEEDDEDLMFAIDDLL